MRDEPRALLDDPFARSNKNFKDLGGYVFDGSGGDTKVTKWLSKWHTSV